MGVKNIQGEVRINNEKVATQDWLEDTYVEPLKDELETNNTIMAQGGLHKQEDIVDTYNERITAKGENVLDNSEAVLKKVVGSTVACNNLFDISVISVTQENNVSWISKVEENLIEIQTATQYSGNGYTGTSKKLKEVCPYLQVDDIVYLYFDTTATNGSNVNKIYVDNLGTWEKGTPKTITAEALEGFFVFYCDTTENTATKITNFRITEEQNAPYQPYFTGLKSASFAGIESGGRNLFDTSFIQDKVWETGSSVTVNADGSIHVIKKAGNTIQFNIKKYFPAGVYTLSNGLEEGSAVYVQFDNAATFSVPKVKKTWSGGMADLYLYSVNTVDNIDVTLRPQLEHGTVTTEFTPYIEPTVFDFSKTPTPMGTTIDLENKKIIEGSREIVLKGTENWGTKDTEETYTGTGNRYRFGFSIYNDRAISNAVTVNTVSSRYISVTPTDTWECKQGLAAYNDNIYIYDEAYATKTVDEFKAHLAELYSSGNPVVVRYLLATPTERDFTDEEKAKGNEYQVWANGTEKIIDNDGKEYGADNTLIQNYTIINAIPKSGYADQNYVNNKFLPKITTSTTYEQAYVKASGGNQSMINIAATPVANTIAKRDSKGQILTSTPTSSQSATPRNYVDEITDNLQKELTLINTALTQSGIVYTVDVEDTYNERVTADGLNTLDNSEAVLKKVVGSTVKCENLIPYPYSDIAKNGTVTMNGITFTDNGDGTITINGTATAEAYLHVALKININAVGDCFISGTPSGGGYNSYRLYITNSGNTYTDIGAGKAVALVEGVSSIAIVVANGATLNNVIFKPMLNEGPTAKPYQPYFTGLKSASFAGIESGGRNLFNTSFITDKTYANGSSVTVNADSSIRIIKKAGDEINYRTTKYFSAGTYTLSNGLQAKLLQVYLQFSTGYTTGWDGQTTFDWKGGEAPLYLYAEKSVDNVDVTFYPMLNHGSTALPYTPYIEPTVFNFPKTSTPMGTTMDFENKKIIQEYAEITQDTPFTEEQLAEYTDYLISQDGKTIRYKLATPTETPFTEAQSAVGNKYQVWSNGTEKVIDNEGKEYGAENTFTQNYIAIKEV